MSDIQQELAACRESAEIGYQLAQESFEKLQEALEEEREKLREADRRQQSSRLENDSHFQDQLWEMNRLERETVSSVEDNLRDLRKKMADFTIVLYGRTMAGKSTLMEILRHGDGSSIGKGAQRTTRDVRAYTWNGLKIFDVPGTCSFGGESDDRLAYEAAKDADIALFLLTDDAPQPSEAQRLAELRKLGKPVLGIVNVKQVLSPERNSAKRKMDLRQLDKKIHDKTRLEEIVQQFKEFSKDKGYNFEEVPFVYSHLQSAFFSQRENDSSLYELSNFAAVENFIIEKVQNDGPFIRIKTFVDAVARPMQKSIATLYGQSSETVKAWKSYGDKITALREWHESFLSRAQSRYNNFRDNLESQLNAKINYIVNNYYDTSRAGEYWMQAVEELNIARQCQSFIEGISEEVTDKLHELSDELTQDLEYAGVDFSAPEVSYKDTDDVQGGLLLAAPFLALTPVGWAGAALFGLGSLLFGKSKSEKIAEAKQKLRAELIPSRDEILSKTTDSVLNTLNGQIIERQIVGFGDTLYSMRDRLADLAYAQNAIADTINFQYQDLNFKMLVRAAMYSNVEPDKFSNVTTARIVGREFVIINATRMYVPSQRKISNLIGEKVTVYEVTAENYFDEVFNNVRDNILNYEFSFTKFYENEDTGDMYIILLPRYENFSDTQIELTQQLFSDPVVFY